MEKFNLIDEPWIPVLKGGRVVEVGIGEALLRAHEFARIETPSPLEEAVLHRLLLAVLCAGLLLYFVWRLMSIAVLRGHDASTCARLARGGTSPHWAPVVDGINRYCNIH